MMRSGARKPWFTVLCVAAVVALIALIAGCGGQKSGEQTGSTTPTDSMQAAAPSGGTSTPAPEAQAPGGTPVERPGATRMERPRAPAAPRNETIAAGTSIEAALGQEISTANAKSGDKVELTTTEPVMAGGRLVIPAGSTIRGEVTESEGGGRIAGSAKLTLTFHELVLADGTSRALNCEAFHLQGKSAGKESALEIGGGAVAGGVVGGLLGGKKDIVKGAAAGAVVGTGVAIATKGKQLVLPAGQKLKVTLSEPVTLPAKKSAS